MKSVVRDFSTETAKIFAPIGSKKFQLRYTQYDPSKPLPPSEAPDLSVYQRGDNVVRILSFNVRYRTVERRKEYQWKVRLPLILHIINQCDPDIICLQETLRTQLWDIIRGLRSKYLHYGRDRSSVWFQSDESNPILYRASHQLEWGETIQLPRGGAPTPRIVTIARLRLDSGLGITIFNTHLEHARISARRKQAEELARIVRRYWVANYALAGDFNEMPASPNIAALSSSIEAVPTVSGPTFNGWGLANGSIDNIFLPTSAYADGQWRGQVVRTNSYPSDHWPITVDIKI